jgi:LCP family protein required for cell wall assembly
MKKFMKILLISVPVLIIGFVSYYIISIYNSLDNFSKPPEESRFQQFEKVAQKEEEPPKWTGRERVNILLLGGDERGLRPNEIPRSDTMMLVSIDPTTKEVSLFSILRDTYVDIPGHSSNRINSALALGGPKLAMKTVGELLGLPIQYYVYTDFEGFIALVDAIGGIDFEVEKDMKYSDSADNHVYDIDLKKGYQHLDGKKALQYVRFRHDAMSDFTRTERQRNFLKAVADKMQDTWSIVKMPQILEAVNPYIETNLSVTDMIKLANTCLNCTILSSEQIPPMELLVEKKVGGASVLAARDEEELKQYVQAKLNPPAEDASRANDGNGDGGGAGAAAAEASSSE